MKTPGWGFLQQPGAAFQALLPGWGVASKDIARRLVKDPSRVTIISNKLTVYDFDIQGLKQYHTNQQESDFSLDKSESVNPSHRPFASSENTSVRVDQAGLSSNFSPEQTHASCFPLGLSSPGKSPVKQAPIDDQLYLDRSSYYFRPRLESYSGMIEDCLGFGSPVSYLDPEKGFYVCVNRKKLLVLDMNLMSVEQGEVDNEDIRQLTFFQRSPESRLFSLIDASPDFDSSFYIVVVTDRLIYLYLLLSGRTKIPLYKTISGSDGHVVYCSHDPVDRYLYVFSGFGKLQIMDERYLHVVKQIQLNKGEISSVTKVTRNSFLVGSTTGTVEYVALDGEQGTYVGRTFFYDLKKVTQIRCLTVPQQEFFYFAYRTELNTIFVWQSHGNFPLRMVDIDPDSKDVTPLYFSLL